MARTSAPSPHPVAPPRAPASRRRARARATAEPGRLRGARWLPVAAALLVGASLSGPLHAQTVKGRMVEAGTQVPVPGALVELRDARDSVVDRVLSDPGGRFSLKAPVAGKFTLHTERIGYRNWTSDPFDLAAGQEVTRLLHVSTQAVSASDLSVQADRKCRLEPQLGVATYLLWDEVRKALRVTVLSREGQQYRYVREKDTRDLNESGHKVTDQKTVIDTTVQATPYPIQPAEQLARNGFVSGDVQSGRKYYIPGVETLLAGPFLETHCIELGDHRDVDGERWIGLDFKPAEGRSLPDISGTLWMTEHGSELREMDFHYVNVEVPVAPRHRKDEGIPGGMMPRPRNASTDWLGGKLTFRRLPSGRWIIRDWHVALPVMGATDAWWDPTKRYEYVLTGRHEEGGEILHVSDASGRDLFDHERAALSGFVADSSRGTPLVGAVVKLEGTPYSDTTDADGHFELPNLPGGKFKVTFEHPRLDSLGVGAPEATVELAEGSTTHVALAIPSPKQALAAGCPKPAGDAANLVGILRDETSGVPLPFARLTLRRGPEEATGNAAASGLLAQGRTDGSGAFKMCGVPAGSELGLAVTFPGRPAATLRLSLAAGSTVERDVSVPSAAPAGVVGRVVSAGDQSPLAGATVELAGSGKFTTANDGRFHFDQVPEGAHEVKVELQGYGPALDTVQLASGQSLDLEVRLPTKVVAAAPIQVVVMRSAEQGLSRRSRRLYEMDRVAIDSVLTRVPDMTGLLQQMQHRVPGLLVEEMDVPIAAHSGRPSIFSGGGGTPAGAMHGVCVSTTHGTPDLRGSVGDYRCAMVQVYIDDAPVPSEEAATVLENLDPQSIERMQFVPAVDAGARYGTGSNTGVLLIYTRAGGSSSDSTGGS